MRVAVVTVLAAVLVVRAAFGACLLNDYTGRAEFERSTVVALGRVVAERLVSEQKELGLLDGTIYTLRIQETFRGKPSRTISIFSENSSGRFPMERGKSYIVFLYSQSGRISADNCGNSGLASTKEAVVSAVRVLAHEH